MEFTIQVSSPFNLDFTLESGQLFRWVRKGEWWQGVVGGSVIKVRQEGDLLRCSTGSELLDSAFVSRYFRMDEDIRSVLQSFAHDEVVSRAVQKFYGLRLVRQDRWECLASFVLATNANIPRIMKMVSAVCSKFGELTEFEGQSYATFPSPEDLAAATVPELAACGLGYRAQFLRRVSASVAEGKVDFSSLDSMGYEDARKVLLTELLGEKVLLGVGPKVADCVLLYSFGKDEAFPIDVWIARVLARSYPKLLGPELRRRYAKGEKVKLSRADYAKVSERVRSYFGPYAGYAQQYLFMAAREESV